LVKLETAQPAWIGIALAFYAFVAIGIAEGGLGVLLPSVLSEYGLTPASVTLLFLSQIAGYIFAALSSGVLSARIGLARMVLVAAIALTSTLCIYASTQHWLVMVLAGSFLGLGIGLIDAGINSFIASDQRNANKMGYLHAFYGIGALLGPTIATALLTLSVPWRNIYFVFATIVSFVIVGMIWAIRDPYRSLTQRVEQSSAKTDLGIVLKTPIILVAGIFLAVYVGAEASVGNWAYTVQRLGRGTPNWIAGYSVSGYWFGLTLGRFATGKMTDWFGAKRTITGSLVLLLASSLIWWRFPNQLWSLFLIGFALAAIFPLTIWLMPQRIAPPLVPTAIGFMTSVASLGAATIPTSLGWIANQAGLSVIPGLIVVLAIAMLLLHRWIGFLSYQIAREMSP
jgi:fucose permease